MLNGKMSHVPHYTCRPPTLKLFAECQHFAQLELSNYHQPPLISSLYAALTLSHSFYRQQVLFSNTQSRTSKVH